MSMEFKLGIMEDVGEYEGSKEQSKGGLNDLVVE
jgi:hypothetical protein